VNLGPLGNPNAAPGPDGGLGYNPRCLKRDINPTTAQRFNNLTDILNLLTQNHDIYDFQMQLQGVPGIGIGAHGGGHYTIGGDASDLFASPADPAFFCTMGRLIGCGRFGRAWILRREHMRLRRRGHIWTCRLVGIRRWMIS
jgi:tyrosinase